MPKYAPLEDLLRGHSQDIVRLSLEQIETTLGFRLPDSARRHRGWWANQAASHAQARAWMNAGWKVAEVNLSGEEVCFQRAVPDAPPPAAAARAKATGVAEPGKLSAAGPAVADVIVVARDTLRGSTVRLLEDYCEANGGSFGEAIAAVLNGTALERRRQLLERFPLTGPRSPIDSAKLIRQVRDAG